MTIRVLDKEFRPYISAVDISDRIKELGKRLSQDYKDKKPLLISVLNGSFIFAADLCREIDLDCEIEFVKMKSYEGTQTTEVVKEVLGLNISVEGRDVILVEDIVDTGLTLDQLLNTIKAQNPKSIAIATLIFKKEAFRKDFNVDYVGFEIENKFIVGFGLDYDGYGRNLKEIYQIIN